MSDMILLAVVAFVMTSSSYPSSDSSSSSSSPSVPEKTVNWLEAALSFPRRGYHPVDGIPKPGVEDVCINTTVRDWECGEYKSTLIDIKERLHDVSFPPTELHNIVGDFFANSPAEALTSLTSPVRGMVSRVAIEAVASATCRLQRGMSSVGFATGALIAIASDYFILTCAHEFHDPIEAKADRVHCFFAAVDGFPCYVRLNFDKFFTGGGNMDSNDWTIVGILDSSLSALKHAGIRPIAVFCNHATNEDGKTKSEVIASDNKTSASNKETSASSPTDDCVNGFGFMAQFPLPIQTVVPELSKAFPHLHGSRQWHMIGQIGSRNSLTGMLHHNINAFPGSSGSPIVDLKGQLLGMHLGYAFAGNNLAIDIASIVAAITKHYPTSSLSPTV